MFELQILIGNVLAPAAIVLLCYIALPKRFSNRGLPLLLAICSGVSIWVAMAFRNGFATWPEDAWQRVPIAGMIVALATVLLAFFCDNPRPRTVPDTESSDAGKKSLPVFFQWIVVSLVIAGAAWLIYPRGEAWAELQSQQTQWCLIITLAASLSWWGLTGCQAKVASTVGLAVIPILVVSAFLTSLSFMKVTEPLIAVATVIGLCSLIDLRLGHRRSLPIMMAPSIFAMTGFIAHASFQSYLNIPRTLYFLAMLSPAMLALVARIAQRKSAGFAIFTTIVLALVLAGAIGTWAYLAGEVGSENEW